MAISQNAISAKKLTVFMIVAALFSIVILIIAYQKIGGWSYQKMQPYAVTISLQGNPESQVNIQYDYGYGYLAEHQQVLNRDADEELQEVKVSISAWKTIKKIRLYSPNPENIKIKEMKVEQAGNAIPAETVAVSNSGSAVLKEFTLGEPGGTR